MREESDGGEEKEKEEVKKPLQSVQVPAVKHEIRDGPRINVDLCRGDFNRLIDPRRKDKCPVCEAQCKPPRRGEYVICSSCGCTWW